MTLDLDKLHNLRKIALAVELEYVFTAVTYIWDQQRRGEVSNPDERGLVRSAVRLAHNALDKPDDPDNLRAVLVPLLTLLTDRRLLDSTDQLVSEASK